MDSQRKKTNKNSMSMAKWLKRVREKVNGWSCMNSFLVISTACLIFPSFLNHDLHLQIWNLMERTVKSFEFWCEKYFSRRKKCYIYCLHVHTREASHKFKSQADLQKDISMIEVNFCIFVSKNMSNRTGKFYKSL